MCGLPILEAGEGRTASALVCEGVLFCCARLCASTVDRRAPAPPLPAHVVRCMCRQQLVEGDRGRRHRHARTKVTRYGGDRMSAGSTGQQLCRCSERQAEAMDGDVDCGFGESGRAGVQRDSAVETEGGRETESAAGTQPASRAQARCQQRAHASHTACRTIASTTAHACRETARHSDPRWHTWRAATATAR